MLSLSVRPPADSGWAASAHCGPFAWGDDDVRIELSPSLHLLEVVDARGTAQDVACSFAKPSRGFPPQPVAWQPLERTGPGLHRCPWDEDWDSLLWLRLDAPQQQRARHCTIASLPVQHRPGAVVHRWVLPDVVTHAVLAVDTIGAPVTGASVGVLFQSGVGNPTNAIAGADYDPTTSNPMTANHALLLAAGTTDAAGQCVLTFGTSPGATVRVRHPGHLDAVEPVRAPGAPTLVRLRGAGSIQGIVRDDLGMRLKLVGEPGTPLPYPAVHVGAGGRFHVDQVPAGPCSVVAASPGPGNQPCWPLGTVVVEAGRCVEFEGSARGWRLLEVTLRSPELQPGDAIALEDVRLGYAVATTVVGTTGRAAANLTPGRYRVVRTRSDADVGGGDVAVCANEELSVRSDARVFELTFPTGRARWQLRADGVPSPRTWVRIAGSTHGVARSDADGWVAYARQPRPFDVVGVTLASGSWRSTGAIWSLAPETVGQPVDARR